MDTLQSVENLQKNLGDDLFKVLISPDNTKAVHRFIKKLADTTLTLGGCTFEIVKLLKKDEEYVKAYILSERTKDMMIKSGEEDALHILKHQEEIPVYLRNKVIFIFPNWHPHRRDDHLHFIGWNGKQWVKSGTWIAGHLGNDCRVLCRLY